MSEELASAVTTHTMPEALPLLPLQGVVAYPLAIIPLTIVQPNAIRLIEDVLKGNRLLLLVTQNEETQTNDTNLYNIGTVAVIHQVAKVRNDNVIIVLQGLERAKCLELTQTEPYPIARVNLIPDKMPLADLEPARQTVLNLLRKLVTLSDNISNELITVSEGVTDHRQLLYSIAGNGPLKVNERQQLLEIDTVDGKYQRMIELLQQHISLLELNQSITTQTKERMHKDQRDYFLREQLRSIQKELGEDTSGDEITDLSEKIKTLPLSEEVRRDVERELGRLKSIPVISPEYSMIFHYLDWIIALPWEMTASEAIDTHYARRVLDEDHYGLEKIKERLIEYLAVRKIRQERGNAAMPVIGATVSQASELSDPRAEAGTAFREPILCFVGPPGVGKTSLGQSIAHALGRKFMRIALGGVHDEAEIRGHRRTYVGAMPGRIIQALRRANSRHTVFMLDEIDKLSSDWRGDPFSALLEVLDPAQNNTFVDNYLNIPFDLSQVLFIATANTLETIPAPLLDRMEIVTLSGYTETEKLLIAKRYVVPRQLEANGLLASELQFSDAALTTLIRSYTREAGVRNMEREIGTVCRKIAANIAAGDDQLLHLQPEQVATYLGRPRFFNEVAERTNVPGVATSVAWTPVGGDILFIEVTLIPSKDERVVLTGMLGDVMKESAYAAVSFIKSHADSLQVDAQRLEGKAIHIHVPAGAVPKDGPSAGVTIATALASYLTGRLVSSELAMTGEITLRGKVLPVGGIKEKILAAHRAGIRKVILPRRNGLDLEDVPSELRDEMTYILVDTVSEVLENALLK